MGLPSILRSQPGFGSICPHLRAPALEQQLPFVDLYHDLGDGHADPFKRAFTENGIHPGSMGMPESQSLSVVFSHEPCPGENDSGVLEAASMCLGMDFHPRQKAWPLH